MEESDKLPLKRVELSLTKFNEVAIPHHLDLLRQHRLNIIKYESSGEFARVRSEQVNARRVAQQLRALLGELEALRARVLARDLPRFDALTSRARDLTLKAIVDYLGVIERSCRALVYSSGLRRSETSPRSTGAGGAGSAASTDSVGVLPASVASSDSVGLVQLDDERDERLQLRVDDHELALREREAVLRGWSELQGEVRALHAAWQHVQAAALHQRELVAHAAADADAAADNVEAARRHLSAGERLRAGAWLCGGAAAGALAGGPVGLAVGLKAGAAAALAGSLLGALGVRALGRRRPSAASPAEREKAD